MNKFVFALALSGAFAFGQVPDAAKCSIDGSLVNSATGAPVARGRVVIAEAHESWFAETDAKGTWSVDRIDCGRATISLDRPGFLRKTTEALTVNGPLHNLKLELTPQSVIAGRVQDDQGDPVQGANISLLTSRVSNGLRALQATGGMATDDRGEYRFAGLAAGRYLICAGGGSGFLDFSPGGPKPLGEKCYPGQSAQDGATLNIPAGYEARADFTLVPLSTFNVRGTITGVPRDTNVMVAIGKPGGKVFTGTVRRDGTFVVQHVVPGSYTLFAGSQPEPSVLTASAPIEILHSDVEGVRLQLEPGATVTGTIRTLSTGPKTAEPAQMDVHLKASDGAYDAGEQVKGAAFTMKDVVPGNYRMEFSAHPPFYLRSATAGGRDIAGSEFAIGPGGMAIEIVIADDGGTVEGEVSTDDGPVPGWVYLERDGAPSRNTRADEKGHFRIDTLPPGDYKVYAWDDNENVEYANPEWMKRNGRGVEVRATARQTAQVKVARQTAPPE